MLVSQHNYFMTALYLNTLRGLNSECFTPLKAVTVHSCGRWEKVCVKTSNLAEPGRAARSTARRFEVA
jgi:hypothetical protein